MTQLPGKDGTVDIQGRADASLLASQPPVQQYNAYEFLVNSGGYPKSTA